MDVMPKWADALLIPLISIAIAFLISAGVIVAIGEDPMAALNTMVTGALGSTYGWGYTLYYATNFIFTGLAVSVAFHARMFNIGGEGQAMLGGVGRGTCLSIYPVPSLECCPSGCLDWRGIVRCGMGCNPGVSAGQARQPHRDHDDHVQLYRGLFACLSAGRGSEASRRYGPGDS